MINFLDVIKAVQDSHTKNAERLKKEEEEERKRLERLTKEQEEQQKKMALELERLRKGKKC